MDNNRIKSIDDDTEQSNKVYEKPSIWIGECNVCKKVTFKTCRVCECIFYCSNDHEKSDRKNHKKVCKDKLNIKTEWKKKRILDIEQDVLRVAAMVYMLKYVNMDKRYGSWSIIPRSVMNEDGRKVYQIEIFSPQDPKDILNDYIKMGWSKEVFFEIFCMGKSALYHCAIILAIRELIIMYKCSIEYGGHPVDFYGMANVSVIHEYPPIDLLHKTVDGDVKREHLNIRKHKVLLLDTKNFGRILIDFCAPQYGIIQYDVKDCEYPIWVCKEERQKAYKLDEIILPSDLEKTLYDDLKNEATSTNPDFFPVSVINYKNAIISHIVKEKIERMEKEFRPAGSKKISRKEAEERGLI